MKKRRIEKLFANTIKGPEIAKIKLLAVRREKLLREPFFLQGERMEIDRQSDNTKRSEARKENRSD